jgi:hypothetical protein
MLQDRKTKVKMDHSPLLKIQPGQHAAQKASFHIVRGKHERPPVRFRRFRDSSKSPQQIGARDGQQMKIRKLAAPLDIIQQRKSLFE